MSIAKKALNQDRYTHLVVGGQKAVDWAMKLGTPVEASCGKVWVPSRDPSFFHYCPECLENAARRRQKAWAA